MYSYRLLEEKKPSVPTNPQHERAVNRFLSDRLSVINRNSEKNVNATLNDRILFVSQGYELYKIDHNPQFARAVKFAPKYSDDDNSDKYRKNGYSCENRNAYQPIINKKGYVIVDDILFREHLVQIHVVCSQKTGFGGFISTNKPAE